MQTSRGFEYGVIHFLAPEGGQLLEVINRHLQIENAQFKLLLEFGAVYLTNQRLTPKENQTIDELMQIEIKQNDYLRVHTKPRRFPIFSMKPRIVYEDEQMLVVDKPAMLPVHASVDNLKENLALTANKLGGFDVVFDPFIDINAKHCLRAFLRRGAKIVSVRRSTSCLGC